MWDGDPTIDYVYAPLHSSDMHIINRNTLNWDLFRLDCGTQIHPFYSRTEHDPDFVSFYPVYTSCRYSNIIAVIMGNIKDLAFNV